MSVWKRRLIAFSAGIAIVVGAIVIGVVVLKRVETGTWQWPNRTDLIRVRDRLVRRDAKPSRTIYLERHKVALIAGYDDAAHGVSSVVGSGKLRSVDVPGFSGSDRGWRSIVKCVEQQFAPFDVVVTDSRPTGHDYIMAVVGGKAEDIGVSAKHVGGLAPFSGHVIPKAIVFVFSKRLGNRSRAVCETIAMEVAHAYGLDHQYYCPDVMTYLSGCGKKTFTDKATPCGEDKPRECEGGKPTQNSYRRLLDILGPKRTAAAPAER